MNARCVLPHVVDPDRPRPARAGLLCLGHRARLEQDLTDLVTLAAEAHASMVRHGNPGQRVSGTSEAPLPFHDDISDQLRLARDRLASWTQVVVEEHPSGLHPPRFGLASCADFLTRWLDWISEQPWVDELVNELRDTRHDLLTAARPSHTRRVDLGQCAAEIACDVGTRALVTCTGILRAVGQDDSPTTIACRECGRDYPPEQWRRLNQRLRGADDMWLTAAQLSQLFRIPIGTLQRWASEDQWRRLDGRPVRYHADDFETSHTQHRPAEEAS